MRSDPCCTNRAALCWRPELIEPRAVQSLASKCTGRTRCERYHHERRQWVAARPAARPPGFNVIIGRPVLGWHQPIARSATECPTRPTLPLCQS